MVAIQVVGPGCANCQRLAALCEQVATENGVEAQIVKVTEIEQFAHLGVVLTPGLLLNGKLVSSGKIPTHSTLTHWILEAAGKTA